MNSYFFEIVERAFDRYSWILVVYRKGRRRVIARAYRDYRSPGKAAKAAEALQKVVGKAEIVRAFPSAPHYTFQILRDVLPLPVGSADGLRSEPPHSPLAQSSVTQSSVTRRRSTASRVARVEDDEPAGAPVDGVAAARPAVGDGAAAPARADDTAPAPGAAPAVEPAPGKDPAPAEDKPPTPSARPRKQQTARAPRSRGAAKATARS